MNPSPRFGPDGHNDLGEMLWQDGERVVCRRWRDAAVGDRHPILVVLPTAGRPAPDNLNRLAHEYGLKDDLHPAWAAQPLELVSEHGQTILVLSDPGGEPLDRLIGPPMEIGTFLRLAVALSGALGRLHERGLIHKDIKPTNVLVNSATGHVWLTGFGIASRLARERPPPAAPEFIAGTLAYMAPEQTGRMNRSIDSRSDLYSLGVTLYQMLTGSLPFTASHPIEWVHCHVAKRPVPASERVKNVPAAVSAIVMKLLAKTAEERYQTAAGVESDLRRCCAEWETQRRINGFALGEHDTPDRLMIPEKLYGRACEVEILLASFNRAVAGGGPELVLVSGYSGIGKSSIVNELHKVLVPPRGLFASGKFDQYKRDIPYATLAQAFQSLVRPLLSKSEEELCIWRDAIQKALGPNALLIVDLVPELKLIIGDQGPVPDLPPQDAQRRFQLVFRRFISVFARPEHPLALFLDDLQWLDTATLDLLEDLLTQPDVRHLLLIGAYRDNEVDSAHPLMRKLDAIRQAGATVREIVLAPLARDDLERLIADSLHCEPARVAPLAELAHEKTGGNPFFAIQFVSSLAEEGLLTFDHANGRWSWELDRIHAKGYTDNVVDLMVGKLNRLSVGTRRALQQLACMGISAEFDLLATVCLDSNQDIHGGLRDAVRAGLVHLSEHDCRFLHDRVQEAAYSLIPEGARAATHLRIGRLLASRTAPTEIEEKIFEIVNQLNRGSHLITSANERKRVAQLNLMAGRRARASTAYASAIEYLAAGRALLTDEDWRHNYELIFGIEFLTAECELLTASMRAAEQRLSMLAERADRVKDVAAVARLRLTLYTTLDRSDRGVEVCLQYLRRSGMYWSPHPTADEVQREYDRIWSQLGTRSIEAMVDLPLMTDPEALATLDVLNEIVTPAEFTDENLLSLVICRMVNLSLEHGNSDPSCFAYVWLGAIAGARFGSYDTGFRVGRLGCDLVEKRGLHRFEARTYMSFGNLVIPWRQHVRTGRDLIRRAFDTANRIGDLTFAAYSWNSLIRNLIATGDPLGDAQREAEKGLDFAQRARFGLVVDIITGMLCLIRALRGLTAKLGRFDDAEFDELRFERRLASDAHLVHAECLYWIRKLQARFLAGDYSSAVQASSRAKRLLWSSRRSLFEVAEYEFYTALSRAALWDPGTAEERRLHFEELTAHHKQLEVWAANCPENFQTRAALVSAEIARIDGRDLEAMRLYEQAIRCARDNGFVHIEGIANEVAGRFYLGRGLETNARAHLQNASACFALWGADGKVKQLELLHPRLASPDGHQAAAPSVRQLDFATVVEASQTISGEIVLPKLIDRLMTIALQNAGADRGLLLLAQKDDYRPEAEAWTSGDEVVLRQGSNVDPSVPETIIRYVIRTQQKVILDEALKPSLFSGDDYLSRRQPRSLLCLPLVRQSALTGLLYLENTLTSHVFTPERTAVLELLASQAAISLENTRLYGDLQEREARIRRLVEANIIGIVFWNMEGEITDANDAFLHIVGYTREDFLCGRVRWTDLTPPDWKAPHSRALAQFKNMGVIQPYEREYFRKDGRRVPVLVGSAAFDPDRHQGVSFVLDLSERKRAEAEARESERRFREVQMELAHANRVAAMGQLSASIAHEINQPITAAVTFADAALRWLCAQPPNLEEAQEALGRIRESGVRAGDVIDRVRALVKKSPPQTDSLEINEVILEIVALFRREFAKNGVSVETQLVESLPAIRGDRVQLQQVILNLLINAIEAMSAMSEGSRELLISNARTESGVLVAVRDSGPGLAPESTDRLFESFYTTKPGGLGMGLSICRSIIEAHQGRLWAGANTPHGAVFQFTLPTYSSAAQDDA
jgi:PAS domain S-box-containing protein